MIEVLSIEEPENSDLAKTVYKLELKSRLAAMREVIDHCRNDTSKEFFKWMFEEEKRCREEIENPDNHVSK